MLEAGVLTATALIVALAVFRATTPLLRTLVGADLAPTLFAGARFSGLLVVLIVGVTLAAGAYPAVALARVRPVHALRASRQQLGSKRLSTLLIGTQFAVASLLLIAVTVTVQQNAHLRRTGVTEIGAPPWVNLSATIVSTSDDPNAPSQLVLNQRVGFDFFTVFDIGLVAGRAFTKEHGDEPPREEDSSQPKPPQRIVVDRTFGATAVALEIVGVVENHAFTFFDAMGTTATMYQLLPQLRFQVARVSRDDVARGSTASIAFGKRLRQTSRLAAVSSTSTSMRFTKATCARAKSSRASRCSRS